MPRELPRNLPRAMLALTQKQAYTVKHIGSDAFDLVWPS